MAAFSCSSWDTSPGRLMVCMESLPCVERERGSDQRSPSPFSGDAMDAILTRGWNPQTGGEVQNSCKWQVGDSRNLPTVDPRQPMDGGGKL
jgi:hypothetical protein